MQHQQQLATEGFLEDVRHGRLSKYTDFPYPKSKSELREGVPYLGKFECEKANCGRWWYSSWSWLGFSQKCDGCQNMVYPSELWQKEDGNSTRNSEKPHQQHSCERCMAFGKSCFDSQGLNIKKKHAYAKSANQRSRTSINQIVTPEPPAPHFISKQRLTGSSNSYAGTTAINVPSNTHAQVGSYAWAVNKRSSMNQTNLTRRQTIAISDQSRAVQYSQPARNASCTAARSFYDSQSSSTSQIETRSRHHSSSSSAMSKDSINGANEDVCNCTIL